ncbi:MAG TPA: hypothetical protein VH969_05340 [Actinophytocola sp.]
MQYSPPHSPTIATRATAATPSSSSTLPYRAGPLVRIRRATARAASSPRPSMAHHRSIHASSGSSATSTSPRGNPPSRSATCATSTEVGEP